MDDLTTDASHCESSHRSKRGVLGLGMRYRSRRAQQREGSQGKVSTKERLASWFRILRFAWIAGKDSGSHDRPAASWWRATMTRLGART